MKLILTGGGVGEKARTAFSLFAQEVGNGEVLYIPFADNEMTSNDILSWFKKQMEPYGLTKINIVKTPKQLTIKQLNRSAGVFIGGGNAFLLLKTLKENNCLPLIRYALKNKVVLGLSAGATIFGKDINSCLYDELKIIANDKNSVGLKDTKGIEIFEGYSIFVHYKVSPKQLDLTQQKVDKILSQKQNVIAIPEESCLYITEKEVISLGEKPIEIITKKGTKTFNNHEKINLPINKNLLWLNDLNNKLHFSLANLKDLKKIMQLYKEVIKNSFTTWDENYPNEELIRNDILKNNLYILKYNKEIIATSFLGEKENSDNWTINLSSPISVARICVSPAYQGVGIGKIFLQNLIATAKSSGADGMQFHVCTQNKPAMKMYESCGFKNCGLGKSNYGYDYYKYEQKFN